MISVRNRFAFGLCATILLALSTLPSTGATRFPAVDVQKACEQAQSAQNGLSDPVGQCMSDENAAKAQLQAIWDTSPAKARDTCTALNAEMPSKSYADILTCVQMFKDTQN